MGWSGMGLLRGAVAGDLLRRGGLRLRGCGELGCGGLGCARMGLRSRGGRGSCGLRSGWLRSDGLGRGGLGVVAGLAAGYVQVRWLPHPDGRLFFSDNPPHRYAIGDRTRGLKHNSDGSLDILIQKDAPAADLAANWLPVPESGRLQLTLRLYQPRAEILNGRFHFPALERLD